MKHAIEQGKIDELIATIQKTPQVVHENITFGSGHEHQVHPINFICDCVFENKISESTGLEMVRTLIRHGSSKMNLGVRHGCGSFTDCSTGKDVTSEISRK